MSRRLDWDKAKAPRPTEHKSQLWTSDSLARRAKKELRKWTASLSKRQRRAWEAVR